MTGIGALLLLGLLVCLLISGMPVAIALLTSSLAVAAIAILLGVFDATLLAAIPSRLFGILTNPVLLAIPLFVLMGLILERSRIAEAMFAAAASLFRGKPTGLLAAVTLTGVLMAAATGIVGASVVTLGIIALPALLASGVRTPLASASVAATGTLGQLIPPSIVLIVLGDQISNAYQAMQTASGNFAPETVSVADLFAGALVPGLLLAILYLLWQTFAARRASGQHIPHTPTQKARPVALLAPLILIVAVLGSILAGIATPTEAASIGVGGALLLALLSGARDFLRPALVESVYLSSAIFFIIIGASVFALVFRGLGGDEWVASLLSGLPGGLWTALAATMLLVFLLGFVLEFIEITLLVVPIVAPVVLAIPMPDGAPMSPVWLAVLFAIVLQTSFLTPPFGISLIYLKSAAPKLNMRDVHRGIVPYIVLQLLMLLIVALFPALATWLPAALY